MSSLIHPNKTLKIGELLFSQSKLKTNNLKGKERRKKEEADKMDIVLKGNG